MSVRYQLVVKDTAGVQVALITNFRFLSYSLKINAPHDHQLDLAASSPAVPYLVTDAQIEVWRSDLAAVPPIPWTLDYEGFHRTLVDQTSDRGMRTVASYGRGYLDLIDRREVWYPAGSAGSDKSGPGETVMKAFVEENAGASATAPPRVADGVTSGLTVQIDGGAGSSWEGARSWQNLLDVCQSIADATLVDFAVVGTGPGTFEFQAQAFPIGKDRSVAGLDPATGLNAAGYAPVIFALERGNMATPVYSMNRTAERNAILALGQGLEADRQTVERTDPVAIAASPWNRRESSRNANQETTTAGLEAVGDAALMELAARESFSFSVIQTAATAYGQAYACGDIVVARYGSVQRAFQIVGVTVTVDAQMGQQISVTVKNVPQ